VVTGGSRNPSAGAAAPVGVGATSTGSAALKTGGATATATSHSQDPGAQLAASTTTVTRDRWHVSWWVLVIVVLIAVLGFAAVIALTRATRQSGPAS
jgi:hypothetical protein